MTQQTNTQMELLPIQAYLLTKYNIEVGKRVALRLEEFFVCVENLEQIEENALRSLIYACMDIGYQNKEDTRSNKVMAYRRANRLLQIIQKAYSIAGAGLLNKAGNLMYPSVYNVNILDFRIKFVESINSAIN